MSSFTCCGCLPTFLQGLPSSTKSSRTYRRAKYNEREYSIEFENLIEEEDFYAPAQHAVTEVERDLLDKRKFGELLQHENDIIRKQDEKLKEREENARLEDEAYIQARKEASRVARQAMKKTVNEKSKFPNMQKFDSVEFSKWLSEEKIDITSPELDVEDFESFLAKVRAKSAQAFADEGKNKDATAFEQTLSQGLAATKIAGDALNALQPVELHAVGMPSFNHVSPDVETPAQSIGFDSNFSEPEDCELLNIPDVEIKDDDKVVQSSHILMNSSADIIQQPQVLAESKDQLFSSSEDVQVITPSAEPLPQPVLSQSLPEEVNINDSKHPSETLVDISVDVSQTSDIDSLFVDSLSVSQSQLEFLDSSSDLQQAVLDDESYVQMNLVYPPIDASEKLIDISPEKEEAQLPALNSQSSAMPRTQDEVYDEKTLDAVSPICSPQMISQPSDSLVVSSEIQDTELKISSSSEVVSIATVAIINTPRNVATNLKPIEGNDNLPSVPHDMQAETFITTTSCGEEPIVNNVNNCEVLEDSLNDGDEFHDFDDEFVSSNSNAAFEDYLT